MKPLMVFLTLFFLIACSDFHLGYTPGGNPPLPEQIRDTIKDTTIVPADSLIVRSRFTHTDTIINTSFMLRSGNFAELRYTLRVPVQSDSEQVFGLTIAPGILGISTSQGSAAFHSPTNLSHETAGMMHRYSISTPFVSDQENAVRWYNNDKVDLNVSELLLAGWNHQDSTATSTRTATLNEYRQIVARRLFSIYAGYVIWEKIPVVEGDSLVGSFAQVDGTRAVLLTSAAMKDLIDKGSETSDLWNSTTSSAGIQLRITDVDTLYYVVRNDAATDQNISDTLRLIHHLWP